MQLGGVTSFPQTTQLLNPVQAARQVSTAVTALPAVQSSANTASTSAAAAPASAPPSQPAPRPAAHAATAPAASAAATAAALASATAYTTTVGGTQYSGSVQQTDGEYVASIPNLPGATATGSSLQAAENNLDARIDELV